MAALSPSEAAKIAAEIAEDDSPRATRADVEKFVEVLRVAIDEEDGDAPSALIALYDEAMDMLTWDEADLPPREDLTWE